MSHTAQAFTTKALKNLLILFVFLVSCLLLALFFINKGSHNKETISLKATEGSILPTQRTPWETPGVANFKNLFLEGNKYILFSDKCNPLLKSDDFLHPNGNYTFSFSSQTIDSANLKQHNPIKKLEGTTLILSSSAQMQSMQPHYFHFCEEFILGWSFAKHLEKAPIQTIVFPDTENWKGRFHDINQKIIQSILPNVQILSASQFEEISNQYLVQFEDAIIIDRHACHKSAQVNEFNKMVIAHQPIIKKEYIREIRDAVYKELRTYKKLPTKPTITYIQRSNYRYLEPEFERKLLDEIASVFPDYRLNIVRFENFSYPEQLQIIRNTNILIGAHGNGLTHQIFLPDNSMVIELFPKGAYAMDYQLLGELVGHQYFAIDPSEGVIATPGTRQPCRGDVNQVITAFEPQWILQLIGDYLPGLKDDELKEISAAE